MVSTSRNSHVETVKMKYIHSQQELPIPEKGTSTSQDPQATQLALLVEEDCDSR